MAEAPKRPEKTLSEEVRKIRRESGKAKLLRALRKDRMLNLLSCCWTSVSCLIFACWIVICCCFLPFMLVSLSLFAI